MKLTRRFQTGFSLLEPRWLRARLGRCPFCGPTLLVRLCKDETGARCARCAASTVHLSVGWALDKALEGRRPESAYELSSRGPLVAWLSRRSLGLQCSEYFDDIKPGTEWGGVRCEDVQRLSFADAAFDLVTHTEVFEHVPDDHAGFAELHRVLRPGGFMVCTVPITGATTTVERARLGPNGIEHLLPPAWHTDLIRGASRVLVYRDYGLDLPARVREAGFADAKLIPPDPRVPWGLGRHVLVARKAGRVSTATT